MFHPRRFVTDVSAVTDKTVFNYCLQANNRPNVISRKGKGKGKCIAVMEHHLT